MKLSTLNMARFSIVSKLDRLNNRKEEITKAPTTDFSVIAQIIRHQNEQQRRHIRKRVKREVKHDESKRTTKKNDYKHNEEKKVKQLTLYFLNRFEELQQLLSKKKQADEINYWHISEKSKLKEFLSNHELFEIRRFYSDYNLGDVMLVFDNPDDSKGSKGISLKDALQIFDSCLSVVTSDPASKTRLKWEKEAFVRGFVQLEDLKDGEAEEDDRKWWEKALGRERTNRNFVDFKTEDRQMNNTGGLQRRNSRMETATNEEDLVNALEKYSKSKTSIIKKLYKGRFLEKKQTNSEEWHCSNEKPRDFSTLLRNVIITKLSLNSNTHGRSFLSSDGKKIFIVLKTRDNMLQKVAEQSGLNKQMEFGKVDLLSLEPVDSRYRPLRLKKNNLKEQLKGLRDDNKKDDKKSNYWENDEYDSKEKEEDKEIKMIFEKEDTFRETNILVYLNKLGKRELLRNLVWIVDKLDKHISNIANVVGIDLSHERQELVDDILLDEETMKVFFLYCWIFITRSRDITLHFYETFSNIKQHKKNSSDVNSDLAEANKNEYNDDEELVVQEGRKRGKTEYQKLEVDINPYVVQYLDKFAFLDPIDITVLLKEFEKRNRDEGNNEDWLQGLKGFEDKKIEWKVYKDSNQAREEYEKHRDEILSHLPFMYEIIFRESIDLSNEIYLNSKQFDPMEYFKLVMNKKKKLRNIWDEMNLDPVGPYVDFTSDKDTLRYWKQYEANEKKKKSFFSNMERIKLLNNLLLRQINILALMSRELVEYFPLHYYYQLNGEEQFKYIEGLYQDNTLEQEKDTVTKGFVNSVYDKMKSAGKHDVGVDVKRKKLKKISQNTTLTNVISDTKFNIKKPWSISVVALRNYFGEKIAIYFKFLSDYTRIMSFMAVIGIIAELLIRLGSNTVSDWGKIVFSFSIILWSTLFLELWKRSQATFAIKFGQIGFEEDEAERPSFKGKFYRSLVTDDLNEGYFSPFKRKLRMLVSYFFSLLLISMVIFFVILIFALKSYLINKDWNFLIVNLCGSVLNSVQIIIFNIIYDWVSLKLNYFENHKILTTFENSLVFKSFIFNFVNYFNSLVILSFFDKVFTNLDLCIVKKDIIENEILVNGVKKIIKEEVKTRSCFDVLSTQMQIIFIVNIIKNIPELVVPLIKNHFKANAKTTKFYNIEINPFKHIDEYLEKQYTLEAYATNLEVDGTMSDYLELAVQFGFLCLFSVAFPTAFSLAFINNIAEIQVDKIKLLKLTRRPIPIGADNIGIWYTIFDLISYLAIFCNAALIAYTGDVFPENRNFAFTILLIVFLGIKFCVRTMVPDVPEKAATLLKRHQYIIERVSQGSQSSRKRNYKPVKQYEGRIENVTYEDEDTRKRTKTE